MIDRIKLYIVGWIRDVSLYMSLDPIVRCAKSENLRPKKKRIYGITNYGFFEDFRARLILQISSRSF